MDDISREPDAAKAYRKLEAAIVTLALKPGESTTERQLIDLAGLGRTPVREAIQRLATEGFLLVRPRLGLAVAPLHPGDWLQVLNVRRGIECVLVRSAAHNIDSEKTRAFLQASEQMYAAAAAQDDLGFMIADKQWDEALASASDNAYAVRAANALQAHSRRFWFRYRKSMELAQSANRHIAIIEAVMRGDGEGAVVAMDRLMDFLCVDATEIAKKPALVEPA